MIVLQLLLVFVLSIVFIIVGYLALQTYALFIWSGNRKSKMVQFFGSDLLLYILLALIIFGSPFLASLLSSLLG